VQETGVFLGPDLSSDFFLVLSIVGVPVTWKKKAK